MRTTGVTVVQESFQVTAGRKLSRVWTVEGTAWAGRASTLRAQ